MESIGLIEKRPIELKTRNKTEYKLSEKGLKVNKILYELTIFSLEELDLSNLDENKKKRILDDYAKAI